MRIIWIQNDSGPKIIVFLFLTQTWPSQWSLTLSECATIASLSSLPGAKQPSHFEYNMWNIPQTISLVSPTVRCFSKPSLSILCLTRPSLHIRYTHTLSLVIFYLTTPPWQDVLATNLCKCAECEERIRPLHVAIAQTLWPRYYQPHVSF